MSRARLVPSPVPKPRVASVITGVVTPKQQHNVVIWVVGEGSARPR